MPGRAGGDAQPSAWQPKDWITLAASLSGSLVALLAVFGNTWIGRRGANQRANEEELSSIAEKLDSFFGPFLQLSKTNELLANELRSNQLDPDGFRVLKTLLEVQSRANLSPNDTAIIALIVANDAQMDAMINDRAGMVDDAIQPYFWRASAHFRMIQLAHRGEISAVHGDHRFHRYVYPRELDRVLDDEIRRLRERASLLRNAPFRHHAPLAPLQLDAGHALPQWPERTSGSHTV